MNRTVSCSFKSMSELRDGIYCPTNRIQMELVTLKGSCAYHTHTHPLLLFIYRLPPLSHVVYTSTVENQSQQNSSLVLTIIFSDVREIFEMSVFYLSLTYFIRGWEWDRAARAGLT